MKRLAQRLSLVAVCAGLISCAGIPKDAFLLSPTSLEDRQVQSRKFATDDEVSLLAAGAAVLQDMGYVLDETESKLGLITASKEADATNASQIVGAVVLAMFTGAVTPIDKEQKIRVSFVTLPSATDKGNYIARITFQRIIWSTDGKVSRVETIKEPDIYEGFFDKLSKSVFLEAYKI